MQEEISNQIVIILKNTGRLSAQALKTAIRKTVLEPQSRYASEQRNRQMTAANEKLRQQMRQKEREKTQKANAKKHGKISITDLTAQGKGVNCADITRKEIRKFDNLAAKYGFDYAIESDQRGNFHVYFNHGDSALVTQVHQQVKGNAWDPKNLHGESLEGVTVDQGAFTDIKRSLKNEKIEFRMVRGKDGFMFMYPQKEKDRVKAIMEKQYGPKDKSVQDLSTEETLERVPVNGDNIGNFSVVARKYGVTFTPYKVKGEDKYLVFFRAQEQKHLYAAFRAYTKDTQMQSKNQEQEEKRIPLKERLRQGRETVKKNRSKKTQIREKIPKTPERG